VYAYFSDIGAEGFRRRTRLGKLLKTVGTATANHSGFLNTYAFLRRKLTRSQVAILLYHRVCPRNDNWSLRPLSPESFERQMEYFCRNYEIIRLDKLVEHIRQAKALPEKALVITFDDGYKDNYLYAYPILKKYHIPATIFLTTGHIGSSKLFWFDEIRYVIQLTPFSQLEFDKLGSYPLRTDIDKFRVSHIVIERLKKLPDERKRALIKKLINTCRVDIPANLGKGLLLSWGEVREMHDDGVAFGAHSVNHPVLTNLPLEEAKKEIIQSKKDIEEKLGQPVTAFSYPNGDFNPQIVEFTKDAFACAVAVGMPKLITLKDSPYQLSRIITGEDFNKFNVVFSGLYQDLRLSGFLK
jgi:peptidoglycan/xylan/chitin deacetylase (PgdA/CDA1 family)